MTSQTHTPPILLDGQKFDGTNWPSWNRWVVTTARIQSTEKYLNSLVPKPTEQSPLPPAVAAPVAAGMTMTAPTSTTPDATESMPWHSMKPLLDKWIVRNAWAMGLLLYNCTNPIGLGMKSDRTAAEAWSLLKDLYSVQSTLFAVNTQHELQNTMLRDGDDLTTHITNLHLKWSAANNVSANITDKDFIIILLTSLPPSWDTIVTTLYKAQTSVDLISKLNFHWARIGRNASMSKGGITALTANSKPASSRSVLQCTNPKCSRHGHLIKDCYWEGGGKEGQFPAHFRKKVIVNTPQAKTAQANAAVAPTVTAAIADASQNPVIKRTYMVLMADSTEVQTTISDAAFLTTSSPNHNSDVTYIDSGTSDHCFMSCEDFENNYMAFSTPREGQSASKGAKFRILSQGSVTKVINLPGLNLCTTLKFQSILHTPDLTANLISMGCFDLAGFNVNFGNNQATFVNSSGTAFMAGECSGSMYCLSLSNPVHTMAAKSHKKLASLELWHCCLGHVSMLLIRTLTKQGLLDGLHVTGDIDSKGTCKDCIYGKHTARPYDEKFGKETKLLECVHCNIFIMLNMPLFSGAVYMMLMTDGKSSVKHRYFLTHKSVDNTLQALKDYVAEAETQTGKKLKRLRVDMGKEWQNEKWDEYLQEKGIIMESGTPYAHAQNSVAERGICTVVERIRCMLADSGLLCGLWAETATTAIYLDNFIPSVHHPGIILWEVWTGKQQDISHLRPFGCTAYAKIVPKVDQSKLLPRSIKYVMIGYYRHSAYKLYDPASRSIIKCCNVVFEEGQGHRMLTESMEDVLVDEGPDIQAAAPVLNAGVLCPSMQNVVTPQPRVTDPPLHPALSEPAVLPSAHPTPVTTPAVPQIPPPPLCHSACNAKPLNALEASCEYIEREVAAENGGETWAQTVCVLSATTDDDNTIF